MEQSEVYIGADIGGTKIMAGAVDRSGRIVTGPVSVPTIGDDRSEAIFNRIAETLDRMILETEGENVRAIGLGVTGPLDTVDGVILECPQLPTMHFFPLREKVEKRYGLPVIMDNDANALLLGESIWGAGRGHRIVLGYTLGTGLGCAIAVGGKLFTGTNGMAGEIWPSPDGEFTIEDTLSGRGVSGIFRTLTGLEKTAKSISEEARKGDANAIAAWKIFGRKMADAIAWGINTIDPGIVVLGGSIANSADLFYDAMMERLPAFICPVPAQKTRIVKALLGDNAGFMGAAALAM